MRKLYPEIAIRHSKYLSVDYTHHIYIEEAGNPAGIPVVFLHGGPGAGCEEYHRRFFNPEKYRIILFDQRGSGRSKPHASLENNTTWDLVADMEKIREHLNISQWLIFGGSWGSTLALAYAQSHPDRVSGMILRGIFLCRDQEIEWFYQRGCSRIYPDYWQDFIAPIAADKRDNLLAAYHELLTGDNEIQRLAAAKAWSVWEGRTANLLPNEFVVEHFGDAHVALSMARIENHYFMYKAFFEENQLLRNMEKIAHIPGIIVHGRYDLICPVESAWELHKAWLNSELHIVADASHSALEKGIVDQLVSATDKFAEDLS